MKTLTKLMAAMTTATVVCLGNAQAQQQEPLLDQQPAQHQTRMLSVQTEPGEQVIQTVNSVEDEMIGQIDWDNNIVYGVGDGVPPQNAISAAQARVRAKRAAIDQAYARLLETVQEVRVDAESTTRNFVNESNVVQTRVSGLIKNAEIVELRQYDDGSYQVKMAMPMGGPQGLNATLLPTQMAKLREARIVTRVTRTQSTGTTTAPDPQPDQQSSDAATTPYTGLIVNAKGLGAAPAPFPRILSQSGEIVYDLNGVDPNAATDGMSAYKKSLEDARQLARAGTNPLVIEAVEVAGRNAVDLVLSDEDAEKVMSANAANDFLYDGQVVVIID